MNAAVVVTGVAGFCGYHVAKLLLQLGYEVLGVDAFTPYYSLELKRARVSELNKLCRFRHIEADVANFAQLQRLAESPVHAVIHLAAQPGVRHSLSRPGDYIQANLVGFANVLELCRQQHISHLVYASSSSVYGANTKAPYSERDSVDHPVSLYAATKKANELMAHSYSHLYGLPTTGLRFFTVYGPWGRPDMAPWLFSDAIMQGKPINVFNEGKLSRDFTYVEDVAEAVVRVLERPPVSNPDYDHSNPHPDESDAPYRVVNVGNEHPVQLMDFISKLECALGRKAMLNFLPMQAGDVLRTEADVSALRQLIGYAPSTPIEVGLAKWAHWYKAYHGCA